MSHLLYNKGYANRIYLQTTPKAQTELANYVKNTDDEEREVSDRPKMGARAMLATKGTPE
jgi:hypothetical protein